MGRGTQRILMRRVKPAATTLVLLALALAGCSSDGGDGPDAQEFEVPDLGLEATPTTGVIRGVVVDEAIRPIAGVAIALTGNGLALDKTTGEDGFFGFQDLAPGTYFLAASKLGYAPTQGSTDVVAGDSEPPVVKLQMLTDVASLPYASSHKWEGFMQCGLSVIALCGAGTGLPVVGNVTQDRFSTTVLVDGVPLFIQSESVWDTTTAASNQLWLWHSNGNKESGGFNGTRNAYAWRQGPSPLIMTSNTTEIEESEYGTNNDLWLRMFTGSVEGTRNPADPENCYPGTVGPDVYCGGVGFSLNQAFTVYTTQFFGYLPPEGWRFIDAGTVPPPT